MPKELQTNIRTCYQDLSLNELAVLISLHRDIQDLVKLTNKKLKKVTHAGKREKAFYQSGFWLGC